MKLPFLILGTISLSGFVILLRFWRSAKIFFHGLRLVNRHTGQFFHFPAVDDQEHNDLRVFGGVLSQVGTNFLS
jgi:hypothetical protein